MSAAPGVGHMAEEAADESTALGAAQAEGLHHRFGRSRADDASRPAAQGATPSGDDGSSGMPASMSPEALRAHEADIGLSSSSARKFFAALWMLLVLAFSVVYAWQRAASRQQEEPSGSASRLLDSDGLHHVVLMVSNLNVSSSFYVGVFGGQALESGFEMEAASDSGINNDSTYSSSSPRSWRMVGFGNSLLLLVEHAEAKLQADLEKKQEQRQHRFALRLSATSTPHEFISAVNARVQAFPGLSSAVKCHSASTQTQAVLIPNGGWSVAFCHGPDGEIVEFWRPSPEIAKVIDRARKAWVASASDPRGRDLFE